MIDVNYILVYGSMLFNMMPWHKLEANNLMEKFDSVAETNVVDSSKTLNFI